MTGFEAEWRARFERFARTHSDEASISGWSQLGLRRRVAVFSRILSSLGLPASPRALDLGCGGGTYVRLLAGLGHRTVGLDYSVPSLERARAADPGPKGRYLAGEAYGLPFRDESFDLVVSIGVLQALAEPERVLDEIVRVLRPGGAVVIEALNRRALIARGRRLVEAMRRLPPRVLAWDPVEVAEWLRRHGLDLLERDGIYLPPRGMPALDRLLGGDRGGATIDRHPGLAGLAAHGFLFAARRRAAGGSG
jgi:SAM-dependent methyltransferase